MIKFAVIIPDRGDRPVFLKNCLRLINNQTVQPDHVELVNYPALSNSKDITQRYKTGYEKLSGKGYDVIFFIENDDYYAADYFEIMLREWDKAGRPDLFGLSNTYYYHIRLFAYFRMIHWDLSSAMSTMIKPDLIFKWCPDHEPYTDTYLWKRAGLTGKVFTPEKNICLGIKHGVGLSGGDCHVNRLDRYTNNKGKVDLNHTFLKSICDPESLEFYINYFKHEEAKQI